MLGVLLVCMAGCQRPTGTRLSAGKPAAANEGGNSGSLAIPNIIDSNVTASEVKITAVSLADASGGPTQKLPIELGSVAENNNGTVFATLPSTGIAPGASKTVKLEGEYTESGTVYKFALEKAVVIPRTGPGASSAASSSAAAQTVRGAAFPHQQARQLKETNADKSWLAPVSAAKLEAAKSPESGVTPAPRGDPPGINFRKNLPFDTPNQSTVAEPSGDVGGGVVFLTANWYAAYSTNGGANFTLLDPTTIFPNNVDGGFCCDQIVAYAPGIDRMLWLMQYSQLNSQGESRYRLAAASPAAIKSSGGTAWTYWDITSTQIGFPNEFLDYPDMSVGSNNVYISFDQVNSGGRVIARLPLSEIKSGSTVNFRYTNHNDSPMAYGGHLSQNTADEIFWSGHNTNASLRIFSWQEASNDYFWRDVAVANWPNNNANLTSKTPDNQDWLTKLRDFPGNAVLGCARVFSSGGQPVNQVWFSWSAPSGNGFPQPHVRLLAVDRSNNFKVVEQGQVWNPNYAFAYPAMASNAKGELGMSMEWGGGGNFENHVVGIWKDFQLYATTASTAGTPRFGDYTTIRQDAAAPALFDAFGYGVLLGVGSGAPPNPDTHFVVFGR
jgi:hypothetical protein